MAGKERQKDPVTVDPTNYDWSLPYEKRRELKWPEYRVVAIPFDAGNHEPGGMDKVLNNYWKMGYVHDVTPDKDDPDFRWVMERPNDKMYGKPVEAYKRDLAKQMQRKPADVIDNSTNPTYLDGGSAVQEIT